MDYELTWRNKWLTWKAQSIDDMINSLQAAADRLRAMKARGVVLDAGCWSQAEDHARLVTDDPVVAEEFGFEEIEWDEDEDEDAEDAEGTEGESEAVTSQTSE